MNRETIKKYKKEFDHWVNGGELEAIDTESDCIPNWFSTSTPSFDGTCAYRIKEFVPKQGETILVADYKDCIEYKERVFVAMHEGLYLCIVQTDDGWSTNKDLSLKTVTWRYAKPLEKS